LSSGLCCTTNVHIDLPVARFEPPCHHLVRHYRWMWWEFNPFEVGALSPSSFRSGDFVVAKPPHRKDEDVQDGNLVAPTKRSTSKRSAMSNGSSSSSSSSSNSSNNAHNAIALGPACPAWAFGRVFHDGVCLGVAPGGEQSLGLLLGESGFELKSLYHPFWCSLLVSTQSWLHLHCEQHAYT